MNVKSQTVHDKIDSAMNSNIGGVHNKDWVTEKNQEAASTDEKMHYTREGMHRGKTETRRNTSGQNQV